MSLTASYKSAKLNKTVECTTLYGKKKLIDAEKLVFRPAAYAIIMNEGKILLVNTKRTGKWFFPGGAIEKGETAKECVVREVFEETGIAVSVGELFSVKENFFYYDPLDIASQNFSFLYLCTPETLEISAGNNPDAKDETDKAEWVELDSLQPEQLQSFAAEVVEQLRQG